MKTNKLLLLISSAALLLAAGSCRKHNDGPPAELNTDKTEIRITGEPNTTDSFTVTANIDWSIAVNPAADWLQIDKTSGHGSAVIHVTNTKQNSSGQTQKVTLTLSGSNSSTPAISITVTQKPFFTTLLSKLYGGNATDQFISAMPTPDGGQILAGYTNSSNNGDVTATNHGSYDAWIVKLGSAGAIEWSKTLGGTNDDYAYAINPTADGGYIMAGHTYSNDGDVSGNHGGDDAWVVKLNSTGALQWSKTLGGTNHEDARSISQTSDGGYIIAGNTTSNNGDVSGNHGSTDAWVVKLTSTGVMQWSKAFGGTDLDGIDWNQTIINTPDGGYLMAGATRSNDGDVSGNHGSYDAWLVKFNSSGALQWQKTFGGSGNDATYSIAAAADGGFVMAGGTASNNGDVSGIHGFYDGWVIKVSSTGSLQWSKALGGTGYDALYAVLPTTSGSYFLAGFTGSNDGDATGKHENDDAWLLKLNSRGEKIWHKALGGANDDFAAGIIRTTDGRYVLAGYSGSNDNDVSGNHGQYDGWLLKFE